jgi:hypothetical protein
MKTGFFFLLCLGSSVCGIAACAQGGAFNPGGDGGNGSSTSNSATTGTGGAGGSGNGATTTSTATTSASTSGSGGEGAGGPPCTEDPCRLVQPQCGCDSDEMCTVSGTGQRSCIPEGTVAWGDPCGGANQCVPGMLCLTIDPPNGSFCGKFCAADSDCEAPGGICFYKLDDGNGGDVPDVTLCTENCDPISNSGCTVASTACQVASEADGLQRIFTVCAPAGTATQGALCPIGDECAPSYGCFLTPTATCLKWCVVGVAGGCPGGTACNELQNGNGDPLNINGIQYGACL